MFRKSNRVWLVAVAWAAVIFTTSCTFIERNVFINFVKTFIPAGMPQHLWINFWGAFGLFVVKAYHFTEFALLCFLLFRVLSARLVKQRNRALALAALSAALYAVSDEWHQTFVPSRGGTWKDVVIDCCGIALACALISWKPKRGAPRAT